MRNADEEEEPDEEVEELGLERAALLPAVRGELAQAEPERAEPAERVLAVDALALVRAE